MKNWRFEGLNRLLDITAFRRDFTTFFIQKYFTDDRYVIDSIPDEMKMIFIRFSRLIIKKKTKSISEKWESTHLKKKPCVCSNVCVYWIYNKVILCYTNIFLFLVLLKKMIKNKYDVQ